MSHDISVVHADALLKRRRLPPLDSLRAFEAAARRLSFTAAAEELHVTQGAVSQRIKALECELGVPLFRRLSRRLELTPEGERLARGVSLGLDHIVNALVAIDSRSETGAFTVSVPPPFARRWLMPRLRRFRERFPEIEVQILADGRAIDPIESGADVAIRLGRAAYPGLHVTRLMADSVFPVLSPELLARRGPIRSVDDLLALPLIHDTASETDDSNADWPSWLTHVGAGRMPLGAGLRLDQGDMVVEAAVLGLGVALARASLVADELASGRLVKALAQAAPTACAYYLLCRPEAADCPRFICFREWLIEECERQPRAELQLQQRASI